MQNYIIIGAGVVVSLVLFREVENTKPFEEKHIGPTYTVYVKADPALIRALDPIVPPSGFGILIPRNWSQPVVKGPCCPFCNKENLFSILWGSTITPPKVTYV